MPELPRLQPLGLHTGGVMRVATVATVGQGAGSPVRWLAGSPRLEVGDGLEPALGALGALTLADGRPVAAWWLRLTPGGDAPTGCSADLALLAAVLLRAWDGGLRAQLPAVNAPWDRCEILVTGSGTLRADGAQGEGVALHPVEGWRLKLEHLAAEARRCGAREALVLVPASQLAEVRDAATGLFPAPGAALTLAPVSTLAEIALALGSLRARAAGWIPQGWPAPRGDAFDLLQAALARARAPDLGYVGVDHLAAALDAGPWVGPIADALRAALPRERLALAGTKGLSVRAWDGPPLETPRLGALGPRLRPGFGVEGLADALSADPTSPIRALSGRELGAPLSTLDSGALSRTAEGWDPADAPAATALVVLRGPEDGRRITPAAGDRIGRWVAEGDAEHMLYERSALKDRALSRVHLTWEGPGLATPHRSVRLVRAGFPTAVAPDAPLALAGGDVLMLTPATWLLAIGAGPRWAATTRG